MFDIGFERLSTHGDEIDPVADKVHREVGGARVWLRSMRMTREKVSPFPWGLKLGLCQRRVSAFVGQEQGSHRTKVTLNIEKIETP